MTVDESCLRIDLSLEDSKSFFSYLKIPRESAARTGTGPLSRIHFAEDGRTVIDCFGRKETELLCSVWIGSKDGPVNECL